MLTRATTTAILLVTLLCCGTERSPGEKCEDFLQLVCSRVAECTSTPGADCLKGFEMNGIMCSSATQVSASYDACMSALHAGTCSTLFTTTPNASTPTFTQPAACGGVLSR